MEETYRQLLEEKIKFQPGNSSKSTGVEESRPSYMKIKAIDLKKELDIRVENSLIMRNHHKFVTQLHGECARFKEILKNPKKALEVGENEEFWSKREDRSNSLVQYQTAKAMTNQVRRDAREEILKGCQLLLSTFEDLSNPSFLEISQNDSAFISPTVISVLTKPSTLEGECLIPLRFGAKKHIILEQTSRSSLEKTQHGPMLSRWCKMDADILNIDNQDLLEPVPKSNTYVPGDGEESKVIDTMTTDNINSTTTTAVTTTDAAINHGNFVQLMDDPMRESLTENEINSNRKRKRSTPKRFLEDS